MTAYFCFIMIVSNSFACKDMNNIQFILIGIILFRIIKDKLENNCYLCRRL